ncbi:hypothetical protein B5V02_00500 [Mesorhizobium kowhaii]|uniref:Methyltransferase type 11 n=1 Tax=Mesorhizobium kowhaii TaxID=1300272 RepID=A0A2W7CE53_9HYPH|nr:hypothetical protein B5V02_00500 [Mesorhizobium kowhaii]
MDGVLIATGRTTGEDPQLVYGGVPIPRQACARYFRPDIDIPRSAGFRIAAPLPDKNIAEQEVIVRFDNGAELRPAPGFFDTNTMLDKFRGEVSAKPGAKLIEIGSRARSGNTYRQLFPNCAYFGIDVAPGPNVDLVTDAHSMAGVKDMFDFAFSISVFEHLMMPWVAPHALNRVLNNGALAFIQSHAAWPLHVQPWDFFRFSKEAYSSIFNAFTGFEMIDAGYSMPAFIVPTSAEGGALHGLDDQPAFLLSACLVRKTGEPTVNWSADPSTIFNLNYSHGILT